MHGRHVSEIEIDFFDEGEMSQTHFVCISHRFPLSNINGNYETKTKNVELPRDLSFPIIADIVAYVFLILRISYGMFANSSQNFRILDTFAKSTVSSFYEKALPRTFLQNFRPTRTICEHPIGYSQNRKYVCYNFCDSWK